MTSDGWIALTQELIRSIPGLDPGDALREARLFWLVGRREDAEKEKEVERQRGRDAANDGRLF